MDIYLKDPAATLDYGIDWGAGYLQDGESLSESSWSIFPSGGLAIDSEPPVSSTQATVFVTGGTVGHIYQLTNRIVTDQGRTDERSLTIRIKDR